jgi:hypothetical protein
MLNTEQILVVLLLLAVLVLILNFCSPNKEHLENTEVEESNAPESLTTEVPEKVKTNDNLPTTRNLMSGSGFIPPETVIPPWGDTLTAGYGIADDLDDGGGGSFGLHNNLCSKSCCSEQYPLSFNMPTDELVCANKEKYVPTNYKCNNAWQDSGCVCLTEKQGQFLSDRGGNA